MPFIPNHWQSLAMFGNHWQRFDWVSKSTHAQVDGRALPALVSGVLGKEWIGGVGLILGKDRIGMGWIILLVT